MQKVEEMDEFPTNEEIQGREEMLEKPEVPTAVRRIMLPVGTRVRLCQLNKVHLPVDLWLLQQQVNSARMT